jgi:signal recognition particle subunit SRP54
MAKDGGKGFARVAGMMGGGGMDRLKAMGGGRLPQQDGMPGAGPGAQPGGGLPGLPGLGGGQTPNPNTLPGLGGPGGFNPFKKP